MPITCFSSVNKHTSRNYLDSTLSITDTPNIYPMLNSPRSFQKKLKSYSVFAGVVLASAYQAKSQIIYTDVVPDTIMTMNNPDYFMDLNDDGIQDFDFLVHEGNYSYIYADVSALNSGGGIVADYHAYNFTYGNTIGANLPIGSWDFGLGYICNWGCAMGGEENFIAIRMDVSGETHYGYVKFQRITDQYPGAYKIYEFAVNSIPDEAIYAGEMPQPVLSNIEADPLEYDATVADTAITQTLVIIFPETRDLKSAIVQIDSGYISGEDSLEATNLSGLGSSWDDESGVLTISGNATPDQYNQVLLNVKYKNKNAAPTMGTRVINFAVSNGQPFGTPESEIAIRKIIVSAATGTVNNYAPENYVHVSPNPVSNFAKLEIVGATSGIIHVQIKDVTGRILSLQQIDKTAKRIITSIDMSDLIPGIYFLCIDKREVIKLEKQ